MFNKRRFDIDVNINQKKVGLFLKKSKLVNG